MNILITGANGQLGNEMREQALAYPAHNFVFTDVAELDICNEQDVIAFVENNSIDVVVNCAAYTAVDAAEDHIELNDKLNHIAPGYLAKAIQRRKGTMIHVSTDYVFDGTRFTPYAEDVETCPVSAYGRAKLAGENLVLEYCEKSVIIRTAWLYSTYGNNFVKTMLRLGRERDTLGVIFDQVGTPTYARDLAIAICSIINKGAVRGVYHFSNEGVCSWYDFTVAIHRIAGITGCTVNPIHTADYPSKVVRPHYSVLDKTKIKQTFGLKIPHWEESLQECIDKLDK